MLVFEKASSLKIQLLGSGYLDTRWGAPRLTLSISAVRLGNLERMNNG